MTWVVKICDATTCKDAYAKSGVEPEDDECWYLAPPLAVRRCASGTYDFVLPDEVRRFESAKDAGKWKARRIRYQKARRRKAARMTILKVDAARLPLRVLEGL